MSSYHLVIGTQSSSFGHCPSTSLTFQWLCTPNVGGMGWIPGWGTKILHVTKCGLRTFKTLKIEKTVPLRIKSLRYYLSSTFWPLSFVNGSWDFNSLSDILQVKKAFRQSDTGAWVGSRQSLQEWAMKLPLTFRVNQEEGLGTGFWHYRSVSWESDKFQASPYKKRKIHDVASYCLPFKNNYYFFNWHSPCSQLLTNSRSLSLIRALEL